jgi:hypothetical protein
MKSNAMKINTFALSALLMAAVCGFSQEAGNPLDETDSKSFAPVSDRLLLHTDSFFSKTWYQWGDGTPAQYREVLAHITAVPENESLARQEKILRNLVYTTAGLFLGSLVGTVVYSAGDFDEPWVFETCLYTGMFSFLFNIVTGKAADIKLQSAVDRYNLSVGLGR